MTDENYKYLVYFYNRWSGKNVKLTASKIKVMDKADELYDMEDMKKAIIGCLKFDTYVNKKYKTFEYIFRLSKTNDNINRFKDMYRDVDDATVQTERTVKMDKILRCRKIMEAEHPVLKLSESELEFEANELVEMFEVYYERYYPTRKNVLDKVKEVLKEYNPYYIRQVIQYNHRMNWNNPDASLEDMIMIKRIDGRIVLDKVFQVNTKFKPSNLMPPISVIARMFKNKIEADRWVL